MASHPAYVERYLRRLGAVEAPPPSLAGLAWLQRQHQLVFPFETLSIHVPELRGSIELDIDTLVAKIVDGQPGRGGYCFELNSLFAALLRELGFELTIGAARVLEHEQPSDGDTIHLQPLTHMILFVDIDQQRYLSDVGFGPRGPLGPLPIRHLAEIEDAPPMAHRIRRGIAGRRTPESAGDGWYLQVGRSGGVWTDLYYFDETRYFAADFAALNYYTSHSPDCFATNFAIWCRPLAAGGRQELWGRHFRVLAPDETEIERLVIEDLPALREILRARCGLALPSDGCEPP